MSRPTNVRYRWTEGQDDLIRRRYRGRATTAEVARALGVPVWQVRLRAARLGMARTGPNIKPWTAAEEAFLEEYAGSRSLSWLSNKLCRAETAVAIKMRRLRISRAIREGYTVRELELCFGVAHQSIDRWIRQGLLKARRRNTKPEEGAAPGPWRVSDDDVLAFIRSNPTAFDLSRVDQTWFLGLVLGDRPWKESAA